MPKKPDNDQSGQLNKPRRETLTEKLADGEVLEMPPCSVGYLADYLFEVGPGVSGAAVTHGELDSWQRNTGITLNTWEARTIRRLSIDYLNEAHRATKPDCPAPWAGSSIAMILPSLAAQELKNSVRALASL